MPEFLPILLADESRFARRFLRLFDMISNYRDITSPNHDNELMLIFEFEFSYEVYLKIAQNCCDRDRVT